jgi:hypothetical protein
MFLSRGLPAALLVVLIAAAGCSSRADDESTTDEGELTPTAAATFFDQALTCRNMLAARAGFRDVDLAEGVLRWSCGDVNGVTTPDLGQEYCEFHAVLNGKTVDGPEVTLGENDAVECVFSSVFADAALTDEKTQAIIKEHTTPEGKQDVPAIQAAFDAAQGEYAKSIATQVGPLLKNGTAEIDTAISTMQVGFNTRGAAKALIRDCSSVAPADTSVVERGVACADILLDPAGNRDQQKACTNYAVADRALSKADAAVQRAKAIVQQTWNEATKLGATATAGTPAGLEAGCAAAVAAATPEVKPTLEKICTDLHQGLQTFSQAIAADQAAGTKADEQWTAAAAAGVAFRADDDHQRDIAACAVVIAANGVGWRNSDPSICARTFRAVRCGYEFETVPDALVGFELRGWTNRDALPIGCKYLPVQGGTPEKPFRDVVVCSPSRDDVEAYSRAGKPLQTMCRDRFGVNLALQLPFRAIAKKVEPKPDAKPMPAELPSFCAAFGGGQ